MKLKVLYGVATLCALVIVGSIVGMVVLIATDALGADPACAPVAFVFSEQRECDRLGLGPAPCSRQCGRLCWREVRKEWRWMQGKDGCPRWPGPTPPGATPRPTPTPRATPRPTATTPCDVPGSGWCYTWSPDTDTVICARCAR